MASPPEHDSAYIGVCKANTRHCHLTQTAVCIRKIVQIHAGDEISSVSHCGYIGVSIITGRCNVLLVSIILLHVSCPCCQPVSHLSPIWLPRCLPPRFWPHLCLVVSTLPLRVKAVFTLYLIILQCSKCSLLFSFSLESQLLVVVVTCFSLLKWINLSLLLSGNPITNSPAFTAATEKWRKNWK